jgi:phasin family protein
VSTQKITTNQTKPTNGFSAPAWDAQKTFAEISSLGRENLDTFAKVTAIAAQNYGAISQHWLDFTKSAIEQGVEATRAVFAAKNVKDAIELQSDFARGAFDRYVEETSKISELTAKATNEVIAPLQKRVDEVVTKFGRSQAA